jgi:hypothetical protein
MSFGISQDLKMYEFELDSYDASQPFQSGALSTDWPLFKVGGKRPLENIAAMKIIEVEIPFTWYVINSSNNTFILNETGFPNIPITLTWTAPGVVPMIPEEGNYTIAQMSGTYVAGVSGLLNNSLSYFSNSVGLNYTYSSSYSTVTQKITVWNNSTLTSKPFSLQFGADVNDTGNTNPRFVLGYQGGLNTSAGYNGTVGDFLTAPFAVQLTGPNYLYLNSQKLGNLTDLYLPQGAKNLYGGNSGPQIAKIPINVQPGGVIFWSDPDPFKYFDLENLGSLTEVDFYLTLGNLSGQTPLKLNGVNFSIKLALLENTHTHNNTFASTQENNRVVKRVRIG